MNDIGFYSTFIIRGRGKLLSRSFENHLILPERSLHIPLQSGLLGMYLSVDSIAYHLAKEIAAEDADSVYQNLWKHYSIDYYIFGDAIHYVLMKRGGTASGIAVDDAVESGVIMATSHVLPYTGDDKLRNDRAEQLSAMFATLPREVWDVVATYSERGPLLSHVKEQIAKMYWKR